MATQTTTPVLAKRALFNEAVIGVGLAALGACLRMVGEFAREAAVLLIIFVPLELWKPAFGGPHSDYWGFLLSGTALLLTFGVLLELLAMAALRLKRDLEGTDNATK